MDLERLAEAVGPDLFAQARALAWATAQGCGTHQDPPQWPDQAADVPHVLAGLVHGDLGLAMALYREMPCYANLMYVEHWGLDVPGLWDHLRALTDEPDPRLADPAGYWLWCGPFEHPAPVATTAWREMTAGAGELRLRRLLAISGPVPWPAKAPLLETLAAQPEWHDAVREALGSAGTDYYGRRDEAAARRLLAGLNGET